MLDRRMSGIKYSPYIPNVDAWVDYFKNQPKEYSQFYTIGRPKQKGEDMTAIKLVTPTEQVVQQAKANMRREREEDEMSEEYPVSKKARRKPKRVIVKSTRKSKQKKR